MANTYEISPTLTVSVEKGDYGHYIKIKRGEKWMCLAASLWQILHAIPERLRMVGETVYLTKVKYVEVIDFAARRYVSFVTVSTYQGKQYKHYINFNDDEWMMLMTKMTDINNALFGQPKQCVQCNGLKTPLPVTEEKRMKKSKLSKKQLKRVLECNAETANQLGVTCTYCGCEGYMGDDNCHCHRFDCKDCEPDNFCHTCKALKVYPTSI